MKAERWKPGNLLLNFQWLKIALELIRKYASVISYNELACQLQDEVVGKLLPI